MKRSKLRKLVLAGMFLALSYLMPFLTGQIPKFGSMLCPMHIPVLLCGFFCGWYYGLAVGFIAPLLRALTLGMPPLFPTAICMAFELATYGMLTGIFHKLFQGKKALALPQTVCLVFEFATYGMATGLSHKLFRIKKMPVLPTLLIAMILGRIVWGAAMFILVGASGGAFTFSAFLAGAFLNAWPGILLQILFVPPLVIILDNPKLLRFN